MADSRLSNRYHPWPGGSNLSSKIKADIQNITKINKISRTKGVLTFVAVGS